MLLLYTWLKCVSLCAALRLQVLIVLGKSMAASAAAGHQGFWPYCT
jgi:hypothetical protein